MNWLRNQFSRASRAWAASCLRHHIAQLEFAQARPDLWASDDAAVAALYAARIAELRCELAALEMQP